MKRRQLIKPILTVTLLLMAQDLIYAQCPPPNRSIALMDTKQDSLISRDDFIILHKYYAKTIDAVYFNHIRDVGSARAILVETYHIIEGADPNAFQIMRNNNFAYDDEHVYFHGYKIEDANPNSFEPLNNHFSKDENHIFQGSCKVDGADRDTFKVEGENYYNYAYDKNYLYFYDDKTEIDMESFERKYTNVCEDKDYSYSFINHKIKKEKKVTSENESTVDSILNSKNFKREINYDFLSLNYNGHPLLRPGQTIETLDNHLSFRPDPNGQFLDQIELITDYLSLDDQLSIELELATINGMLFFSADQKKNQIFNISGYWSIATDVALTDKTDIINSITEQLFPVLKDKLQLEENWTYQVEKEHYFENFSVEKSKETSQNWMLEYHIEFK